MNSDLSYSVIMAVKNGVNYIHDALGSVLEQSLKPFEVLVIDDHSTDLTKEVLMQNYPDISVIDSTGAGQLSAMNLGIGLAKCDVLAFLDHDDLWVKDKQEIQLNFLARNKDLEAITSGVSNFTTEGDYRDLGAARVFGATSFRRDVFSKYGYLDESISHHGVIEWWLRAEHEGINFSTLAEVGLMRRIHSVNSGNVNRLASRVDLFSILRKQISEDIQNEL
jgi:glycosyltransferase involved in cell wall biosynthesis